MLCHTYPCAAGLRWNPSTCLLHQHRPCGAMEEASLFSSLHLRFCFSEEPWGWPLHRPHPSLSNQAHHQLHCGIGQSQGHPRGFYDYFEKRPIPYLFFGDVADSIYNSLSSDCHLSSISHNCRARSRAACAHGNSLDRPSSMRGSWEFFFSKLN